MIKQAGSKASISLPPLDFPHCQRMLVRGKVTWSCGEVAVSSSHHCTIAAPISSSISPWLLRSLRKVKPNATGTGTDRFWQVKTWEVPAIFRQERNNANIGSWLRASTATLWQCLNFAGCHFSNGATAQEAMAQEAILVFSKVSCFWGCRAWYSWRILWVASHCLTCFAIKVFP